MSDARTPVTKRTSAALSHAVEEIALGSGDRALVLALFQHRPYFDRMAERYRQLVDAGVTVVTAYAGPAHPMPGIHHVALSDADPLTEEWTILLVTEQFSAYVVASDLHDLDLDEHLLEAGRRFTGEWGVDRPVAAAHVRRLLGQFGERISDSLRHCVEGAVERSVLAPTTYAEIAMGRAAVVLGNRLEAAERTLATTRAALMHEMAAATCDALTGLTNREGLRRWLGGRSTDGLPMPTVGVVLIDLDGFKQVNDTHGHLVGDELLVAVSGALAEVTRPGDLVVRWGGDEFVVVCPGVDEDALQSLAQRLVAVVCRTEVQGISVSASAGAQLCSRRPLPLEEADSALYEAKRAGGGRVVAVERGMSGAIAASTA